MRLPRPRARQRGPQGQVSGITGWHLDADEPLMLAHNTEFGATPDGKSGTPAGSACISPDLSAPIAEPTSTL